MTIKPVSEQDLAKLDNTQLHKLELIISKLLRVGVMTAGVCLLVGWIGMWMQHGSMLSSFHVYEPEPLFEKIQWALLMRDRSLLMATIGLVFLVCLPLVRVLLTGILFIRQKDYKLAVMAFAVFATLVASFFLGIEL
ncbi:hypothetical protein D3C87_1173120 [compost metagenome]